MNGQKKGTKKIKNGEWRIMGCKRIKNNREK